MKILSLFLFISVQFTVSAQTNYQSWKWAKSFGGTGKDSTIDIKLKNGFLYVTGTFSSPTINWEGTTLTNNGGTDIFIAKLDANGNTIWVKNFGGTANDSVSQLEVNDNGTIALLCNSKSNSVNLGAVTLNIPVNFYIEVDKNGNVLNATKLPTLTQYYDIAIDYKGAIYLTSKYDTAFSFAGSTVDTAAGAPYVFGPNGYYSFPKFGDVLLKYNPDGTEAWTKAFHTSSSNSHSLFIEYNNSDSSIVAIFNHWGETFLDGAVFNNIALENGGEGLLAVKVFTDANSTTNVVGDFISTGYWGLTLYSFKIGHQGKSFISIDARSLNYDPNYLAIYDSNFSLLVQQSGGAGQYGDNLNVIYNLSSLTPDEDGNNILINRRDNTVDILDTTATSIKKFTIAEAGALSLWHKCAKDTNAVYFGDSYTKNSMSINTGISGVPVFNLQNNGSQNIFIGAYNLNGINHVILNSNSTTVKICSDSVLVDTTNLIISAGSGNLQYRWSPATGLSNPAIANPKVFINTDTLISTLTITDANGSSASKQYIFYKGKVIDLELAISDTLLCEYHNATLSLQGTAFAPSYVETNSGVEIGEFDVINTTLQYSFSRDDRSVVLKFINPSVTNCFAKSIIPIKVDSSYFFNESATICPGNNYTFPDGTNVNNITTFICHESHFNPLKGCDSIISTCIDVNSPQFRQDWVCAGSNYTLPDKRVLYNIRSNISDTSYLSSQKGCDSIIITNIYITTAYSNTNYITLCPGSNYTFPDNSSASNITSDTTQVSVLSSSGCDSTITTIITVNLIPVISTANISICKGASYTFPDGSVLNNIMNDTSYESPVTGQNCAIERINITVTHIDTSLEKDHSILTVLSADSNFLQYQWLNCSTNNPILSATNKSYTATSAGTYAVKITDGNLCVDTSNCYTITTADIGLERPAIALYPVPAQNKLTIIIQAEKTSDLDISLMNSFGVEVKTENVKLLVGANTIDIDVSTLPAGIYLLKLLNKDTQDVTIKKIIKN